MKLTTGYLPFWKRTQFWKAKLAQPSSTPGYVKKKVESEKKKKEKVKKKRSDSVGSGIEEIKLVQAAVKAFKRKTR